MQLAERYCVDTYSNLLVSELSLTKGGKNPKLGPKSVKLRNLSRSAKLTVLTTYSQCLNTTNMSGN